MAIAPSYPTQLGLHFASCKAFRTKIYIGDNPPKPFVPFHASTEWKQRHYLNKRSVEYTWQRTISWRCQDTCRNVQPVKDAKEMPPAFPIHFINCITWIETFRTCLHKVFVPLANWICSPFEHTKSFIFLGFGVGHPTALHFIFHLQGVYLKNLCKDPHPESHF